MFFSDPSIVYLSVFHRKLIVQTWEAIKHKKEKFGTIFYSRLFDVAPGVVPLFRMSSNMNEKLVHILNVVIVLAQEGKNI